MTITTRTRTARARLAAVVGGIATIAALGMTAPAATAAPDDGAAPVQVEAVTSKEPVMLSDIKVNAAKGDIACAVRDGRFGCFAGTPGKDGLVVARLYRDSNYRGPQVIIFNPEYRVGCTSRTSDNEGGSNLGAATNRVSSVKTYNHCDVKLYNGNGQTGSSTGYIHQDNHLGGFNDRANSYQIS